MALAAASIGARPLAAQIDYRNLDEGRPVATEDAYPVERHAFELVLPYAYENPRGGARAHLVTPELAYGIAPNMQVGAKLPLLLHERGGSTNLGFAGPRIFALYNFNTESLTLPALALRTDAAFPLGSDAGDAVRVALTGIATRSWGRTRVHLNAAAGVGSGEGARAFHGIPDWSASLAVDRTVLRRSLLVIGEIRAEQEAGDAATATSLGLGSRMQLTPTIVLDAGVERRLGRVGAEFGFTIGLSHAFAIAGLMPLGVR